MTKWVTPEGSDITIPVGEVLAFDPGKSTGVVGICDGEIRAVDTVPYEEFLGGTKFYYPKFHVWVVEGFTPRSFNEPHALKVIGILEMAAKQGGVPLHVQNVGLVKPFATDDKLKACGWWSRLNSPHEKDAARHALYYLFSKLNKED